MPRPPRCRRICGIPKIDAFYPSGCEDAEPILLTLDEYEVIRLVDLCGTLLVGLPLQINQPNDLVLCLLYTSRCV